MLRLYLENEIIELSNNLEIIWVSVLDKYEKLFENLSIEERVEWIKEDLIINESVVNMNKKGYELICLQHPVSFDLRRIITVIKIATEIERIGDKMIPEIRILHEVIGQHIYRAISCYREEQSGCIDMVTKLRQNEIEELSIGVEKKIMNYIFEDDGSVSEVIGALDMIHHLDKIAHTTQAIYKWIIYRKNGNLT